MVKDMVNLEHNKTLGWLGVKMYLEECWEVRMKKWAGKSFVCHLLKFGLYSGAHKDPVYFFVCLFCDVLKRGVTWSVGLNELELFRVLWITCSLVKLSSIKWEKSWLLYILGSWDTMSLLSSHYVILTGLKRINLWKVRQLVCLELHYLSHIFNFFVKRNSNLIHKENNHPLLLIADSSFLSTIIVDDRDQAKYLHICMHTIHTQAHMYYMHIYVHVYAHIYRCVKLQSICVYICMYIWMYVCVYTPIIIINILDSSFNNFWLDILTNENICH